MERKSSWKYKSALNKFITIVANIVAFVIMVFFILGVLFCIWQGMKAVWNLLLAIKGCQCAN